MQSRQSTVRDNHAAVRPGYTRNRYLRLLEYACWIGGLTALGCYAFVRADTLCFQTVQARRFAALGERSTGAAEIYPGELFGMLSIPRIGVSAVVLEGDDQKTLRRAVGHIPGTAIPGGPGTVGLAGHRDTFFRSLGSLQPNDEIVLETRSGAYRYRVATTAIVEPQSVEALRPLGRRALALVTCYPFDYIGPAPRRFVVTAWEIAGGAKSSAEDGQRAKVQRPMGSATGRQPTDSRNLLVVSHRS
jgi:sortase A